MAKSELIARQSAHPTGLLGQVVARVMALDTARVNRRVLDILEPKPGEQILEVGCGHGRTLRRIARRSAPGPTAGVDPSAVMRDVARRHNRAAIAAGGIRVDDGDAAHIPHPDESFDKVVSVHTLYFWPDVQAGLGEIRRVLRDSGQLLLVFNDGEDPKVAARLPATVYTLRSRDAVKSDLVRAGFRDVAVRIDPIAGVAIATAHR